MSAVLVEPIIKKPAPVKASFVNSQIFCSPGLHAYIRLQPVANGYLFCELAAQPVFQVMNL